MRIIAFFAATLLAAPLWASPEPPTIEAALHSLYNFDFPATHATLDAYIAAHPQEALPYAFRGAAYLFRELDRMGALEMEFLTDDDRLVEKTRPRQPDPAIRSHFLQAVADAQKRAQATLAANPNDRDALFALCVVGGISTDYMALVEKQQIASLSQARRANAYAQRLLKLDPQFYDAYLTAGFSEYMIGSLPFFIRWFVHFDNVEGNKQRGVSNLELVAREGHYFGPLAKVFLGIIDLREKRPAEARTLLAELVRDYPQNPLYRKELDKLQQKSSSVRSREAGRSARMGATEAPGTAKAIRAGASPPPSRRRAEGRGILCHPDGVNTTLAAELFSTNPA